MNILNKIRKENTELFTKRLSIKLLDESDTTFIKELTNTKGWLQFIGNRNTSTNIEALAYVKKTISNPNAIYFKVCLKKSLERIGVITLVKRDYLEDLDIGFAFLPKFSNQGFAFESSKLILDTTIYLTKSKTIYGVTISKNTSSISLLTKLKMKQLRTIHKDDEELLIFGISLNT
ncbi:GNAT family N-acetyltransferase [Tenacibaculum sp. 190524A05c]|uniref:GNAT family N-acetyltransferase n=1 Tax=Tenacibaculum platacis TaxID=3137852 RepID=UPI0031FB836A